MIRTELFSWTGIAFASVVLLGVFLALGYGLIGIFLLLLLLSMAGGALLYWWDGEGEE